MVNAIAAIAAASALWLAAGASPEAAKITIKSEADPSFTFAGLKTWAWHPDGTGNVRMAVTANSRPDELKGRVEPVLVPAVERELTGRGFTKVDASPDLFVFYYLLVTVGQSAQEMGQFSSIAQWGLPPFAPQTTALRAFPAGTLILDISSAARREVVWRGAAQGEIDLEKKPEERKERLTRVVHDLLQRFPPKKK